MSTTPFHELSLAKLYQHLATTLGPSGWWPADSPYEILVGAILVQNTNWQNVAKSLSSLRQATHFDPEALAALPVDKLQALIRPSGFYVHKSQAIHTLFTWLAAQQWDLAALGQRVDLRRTLLALPGIGPETADAMRLYVFAQPTFIADHYSRRLFAWLGQPALTYAQLKSRTTVVDNWPLHDAQELHGLIDNFGKQVKTAADFTQSSLANMQLRL
ncbi:endonuclease III domain-containing protein [Lacticaseibacillus jixiensis]|uniref:endonuclease III domain-containing protein n=1 Tax=Lacticaseibacillus jixiensis TaxID=3231926 RepID=UPI0036F2C5F4